MSGFNFQSYAPVTIHWNGSNGPVLASVIASRQGTFSTSITIPAGTPDTYTVVGIAPNQIRGTQTPEFEGRASYTITGPSTAGSREASSNDSSGSTSGDSRSSRGGGNSVSASGGSGASGGVADRGGPASSESGPAPDGPSGVVESRSGEPVFADSASRPPAAGDADDRGTPSARSAAADLWAGFGPPARDILADSGDSPATGGSMPAVSAVLLALGAAAALGGFGLAGVRRRARARASSD